MDAKQAFNNFGIPGRIKHFKMARPIMGTDGAPGVYAGLNIDYDNSTPSATLSTSPSPYGSWDSATWDTSTWGGDLSIQKNWQATGGIGYSAAMRLLVSGIGTSVYWYSTDFVYEVGGVI